MNKIIFIIFSTFIPLLLAVIWYFNLKIKKIPFSSVDNGIKFLIVIFLYAFILYLFTIKNWFDTGWAFYAIIFFTTPIFITLVLIKIYYCLRGK